MKSLAEIATLTPTGGGGSDLDFAVAGYRDRFVATDADQEGKDAFIVIFNADGSAIAQESTVIGG